MSDNRNLTFLDEYYRNLGEKMLLMKTRKTTSNLLKACMVLTVFALTTPLAKASDFVFDLTRYSTGQDIAYIQVTAHQQDANTIRMTVDQLDPVYYGDLRGLFFHVNESLINPTDLSFNFVSAIENDTFASITPSFTGDLGSGLNTVNKAGSSSNNMNGVTNHIGMFDIGFEFGSEGATPDDIKSATFDITRTIVGNLDLSTFFPANMVNFMGARVMSLRPNGGSSKLTCCTTTTVPEPSSSAGLLALAFGGLLWRRRRAL